MVVLVYLGKDVMAQVEMGLLLEEAEEAVDQQALKVVFLVLAQAVKAAMEAGMEAEVAVATIADIHPLEVDLMEQFVSFGPAVLVHFHQLVQGINNEPIH